MPADSQRQRMRDAQFAHRRAARMRRIIIVGSGLLAVVLVAVMAVVLVQQSQKSAADAAASAAAGPAYPPNATDARDGITVYSNPGKPVVGLYFDYQCKGCYQFDSSFGSALGILGQTHAITLVFHTMVSLDGGNADGNSHKAALAAACADTVDQYGPYNQALWEAIGAGTFSDELFSQTIPKVIGITDAKLTQFQWCYNTRALATFVQGVDDAARKAGMTEIPALTVNGKRIPASAFVGKSGSDLKQLIDDAAKAKG
jgi:protein-disulfide isomerase